MSLISKQAYVPSDEFLIDTFRPEDAQEIAGAFRRVYGDHYPSPSVYDPASFIAANRNDRATSFVVRDGAGAFAGHVALVASAPFDGAREVAQGLVLPEYRGRGLLNRLISHAVDHARGRPDCELLFATAVCNHVVSQKSLLNVGFADAGFEVDYAPARLFFAEKSSQGRVATAFECRVLKRAPHRTMYLPAPYASLIRRILGRLEDERVFLDCPANAPRPAESDLAVSDLPTFDLLRTTIRDAGSGLAGELAAIESQARRDGRALAQAVVDLGSPNAGHAVATLRREGYWLGGLLPRWLDSDALLMQKTFHAPNFAGIKVHSRGGRALLDTIMADRATVAEPDRVAA